jgi:hypothetical protein
MLIYIEKCLMAPHLAFALIFLIPRIQTIQMTWECYECSNQFQSSSKCIIVYAIGWFINCYASNKEIEYKLIYMTNYVHSNIIMKALRQLCQTPLYISEKISLKWNWEDLPKFANTSKNIDFEHKIIENDNNDFIFFEKFEEMLEKYSTKN